MLHASSHPFKVLAPLGEALELSESGLEVALRAWTPQAVEAERIRLAQQRHAQRGSRKFKALRKANRAPRVNQRAVLLAARSAYRAAMARLAARAAETEAAAAEAAVRPLQAAMLAATAFERCAAISAEAYEEALAEGLADPVYAQDVAAWALRVRALAVGAQRAYDTAAAKARSLRGRAAVIAAAVRAGKCPPRYPAAHPSVKRESYQIPVITLDLLIGAEASQEIKFALDIMSNRERPTGWRRLVDNRLHHALQAVGGMLAANRPQELAANVLAHNALAQCAATDEARALGWKPEEAYASGKIRVVPTVNRCLYSNKYGSNNQLVDLLARRIILLAEKVGVVIDGRQYRLVAATPSQQKVGDSYFAAVDYMREAWSPFWAAGQALENFRSNGAEELKRTALKFTPSTAARGLTGETIRIDQILMLPEVEQTIVCSEALVFAPDAPEGVRLVRNFSKQQSRFDGEMVLLTDSFGAGFQFRSTGALALKGLAVNGESSLDWLRTQGYVLPETKEDIDGKVWAFPWSSEANRAKYPVAMAMTNTSTWKGKSLGLTWAEAVARTVAAEAAMTEASLLRVVRYADGSEERQRKLGRQVLQQFVEYWRLNKAASYELSGCAVAKELRKRSMSAQLAELAELAEDDEDRTDFARLVFANPGLLLTKPFAWTREARAKAAMQRLAAGRLPVSGSYPFITEDPVSMLQVYLLGMDINNPQLGVLRDGECAAAGYADGDELFGARYPANWFASQILRNCVHGAYASLGGICVLPTRGAALIVMDGDVDGDEAFLSDDPLVVDLGKQSRNISVSGSLRCPVVEFPHSAKLPTGSFASADARHKAIAVALWTTAKWNKVGVYANAAAYWMSIAAEAMATGDEAGFQEAAIKAAWNHVGSILVIDMAKTGKMPDFIGDKLVNLAGETGPMPLCQRYNKGWSEAEWEERQSREDPTVENEPRPGYLPDEIAQVVSGALGEYRFDVEGLTMGKPVRDIMFPLVGEASMKLKVDTRFIRTISSLNFKEDAESRKFIEDALAGNHIGVKRVLQFFWRNEAALKYRMAVEEEDLDFAKRATAQVEILHRLVGEIIVNGAREVYGVDGAKRVINYALRDAFDVDHNGIAADEKDPEELQRKKGSWALFVVKVFARYVVHPELLEEELTFEVEECPLDLRIDEDFLDWDYEG